VGVGSVGHGGGGQGGGGGVAWGLPSKSVGFSLNTCI
jgi:hypothetical protein